MGTRLQLFFPLKISRNFAVNSIFSGSRSTNGFLSCSGVRFVFPASNYPGESPFRANPGVSVTYQPLWSEGNGPLIRVPHLSKPSGNPFPVKSGCIGCLATILIRGKRTPDSSSPRRITPEEHQNFSQLVA